MRLIAQALRQAALLAGVRTSWQLAVAQNGDSRAETVPFDSGIA
jgi:hypothetical protein